MQELLKHIPSKLLIVLFGVLLIYTAFLFTYAIIDGREVTFWPPSIAAESSPKSGVNQGADNQIAALNAKIDKLEQELTRKDGFISQSEAIKTFPEEVQRQDLQQTAAEVSRLLKLTKEQDEEMQGLRGRFLYRLLTFHRDAGCYGDSLNFTYTSDNPETHKCIDKRELARRFMGFLAEIEFYDGPVKASPELAREWLIKYQNSKEFRRTGWYGRDVFKWIVIDYYQKV